jgi:hypothetical protein
MARRTLFVAGLLFLVIGLAIGAPASFGRGAAPVAGIVVLPFEKAARAAAQQPFRAMASRPATGDPQ